MLKRAGSAAKPKTRPFVAERPGAWHLARTETERRLSDFEFGLERLAQAYYRWKAACLAAVCDVPLTGDDVAVLNVVRMGDEPKRLSEIGQLLNRVDVPNLQYATRKLVRVGPDRNRGQFVAQGNPLPRHRNRAFRYRSLRRLARRDVAADARGAGRLGSKVRDDERPARFDRQPLCSGGAGRDHQAASALKARLGRRPPALHAAASPTRGAERMPWASSSGNTLSRK